jgi:C4-dicarboxylate-specific signal transduction histidine kinase
MALLQYRGVLPLPATPTPDVWVVVAFNLVVLNVVGALTAMLADAYRQSRLRLAAARDELERAHDASMRLADEIQRGARLYALGEVVAGVTHEIGNVLQAVAGHAELARRRITEGTADVARHLEQVTQGCESAMRIVRNVLEVGRQAPAEVTAVSVAEIAESLAQLKSYELRRDGIELRLDFAADFPRVSAAAYQVQQVLLNLVKNAQEVLQQSPVRVIEIVGRAEGAAGVIVVRDTGPGIPAPVVPRLFEPFYTTKSKGTGLGLAISAGIVQSLGGDLSAENRREGGAAFRVMLPAAPSSTPASAPSSFPAAVSLGA